MSFEESVTVTAIIAVLVLVAAGLLIWCSILTMRIESALRQVNRLMKWRARDDNGRPYRERL
jgi:uncharacterized integral membrane protein